MFLCKFGWYLVEIVIRGDFEFVLVIWIYIGEVFNKVVIIYMGIFKIIKMKVRNDFFIL